MIDRTIARVAWAVFVVAAGVANATAAAAQTPPFVVLPPDAPAPPDPPELFVVAPGHWDLDFDFAIDVPEFHAVHVPRVEVDIDLPDLSGLADHIELAPAFAWLGQQPPQPPQPPRQPRPLVVSPWKGRIQSPERLYRQGRELIESNRYEQALEAFTSLANEQSEFRDAASYWRAYSLHKLARTADALAALREFQQQFTQSRWLNDARALEAEVKQSAGQPIDAGAGATDDIKLMAARGLIQSDPDKAVPVLERMLSGATSPRLKEQTLFVLSQSNAPRAREIVVNAAKGAHNPDVQVQAIRHIGMMGATQVRLLADIYRESNDTNVKRQVIRSLGSARGRAELLGSLARSEAADDLRADAVRQLRGMQATAELQELYRVEKSAEVKRRIIEALAGAQHAEWIADVARRETDPEVKRVAIQSLIATRSPAAADTLLAIYASDKSPETLRSVLTALQLSNNGKALVDLARKETDATRKREIVQRLSMLRGQPEVTEYLLELLK